MNKLSEPEKGIYSGNLEPVSKITVKEVRCKRFKQTMPSISSQLTTMKSILKRRFIDRYISDPNLLVDQEEYEKAVCEKYEIEFARSQLFLNATKILFDLHGGVEKISFPWHGRSFRDFQSLNLEMVKCIETVKACKTEKDATRFMRKHRVVYDAYFRETIVVYDVGNGMYQLGPDGRHRVYCAQLAHNQIPVLVSEWTITDKISKWEYSRRLPCGWDFLSGQE